MNRAAEAAVPRAREMLVNAVKAVSVTDAKRILLAGETFVTGVFVDWTRTPMGANVLPIVVLATDKVGLAPHVNNVLLTSA